MFDVSKIMKVYSGKRGCMCGCLGSYKVASAYRTEADADRGYPYDDEDISDRTVKSIAKKVSDALNKGLGDKDSFIWSDGVQIVCVNVEMESGNMRTYAVYFAPVK